MRKGYKLLNSGMLYAASTHFNHFANYRESAPGKTRAKAALRSGVIYQEIGQLEESIVHLEKALLFMKDVHSPLLEGVIFRELGRSSHLFALRINPKVKKRREEREDKLDNAESYLYQSIECFKELRKKREKGFDDVSAIAIADLEAEIAISRGTWGLIKFDRGEVGGRTDIENADKTLSDLGKKYELQLAENLIRLMRVLPLRERAMLYEDRVHDLTTKSSPASTLRGPARLTLFRASRRSHKAALKHGLPGWK